MNAKPNEAIGTERNGVPGPDAESRRSMSALADGEAAALGAGLTAWRDDATAREAWHVYHLIGDALRSDELVSPPARDSAMLLALRSRLAAEPVPLGPATLGATAWLKAARRLDWRAPAAVAAGFVLVAGAAVLLRPGGAGFGFGRDEATRIAASAGSMGTPAGAAALAGAESRDGQMIRNARLDAYLRAHQSARGAPMALPGGGVRSVEMLLPPAAQPGTGR